jgi:hypothetical protein
MKTLHNSTVSGARKNVKDIKVVGNGDMFQLLCKASSEDEGWMKSTKAMEVPGVGCFVQVTTQQRNEDGSYSVAEALTFALGVGIVDDENNGRKLVNMWPVPEPAKEPVIKPGFGNYRKKNVQAMRPYVEGEDMTGISVAVSDTPEVGGMVEVSADDKTDRWYVSKSFFEKNYVLA